MKKTLAGLAVLGLVLASAPAGAQDIDTSGIFVKKAIADTMTPDQLQAYKQLLAQRKAAGAFDRAPGRAPGDTCAAATHEIGALPYGPIADTTVGATDNFDLPPDVVDPTCTAAVTCTGAGPAGSLPRGAIYTGTGTGPDRGWRIRTSAACTLSITMDPVAADLALITYLSTCSNSLTDCACVADTGVGGQAETVSLNAVGGTTDYFVLVDGYSAGGTPPGPSDAYTLALSVTSGTCSLVPVELEGFSIE